MQPLKDVLSNHLISLDANAGFPLSRRVIVDLPKWLEILEPGVNPSSLHSLGKRARQTVRTAQEQAARSLGFGHGFCDWVSSGSRANARAAEGLSILTGMPGIRDPRAHDSVSKISGLRALDSSSDLSGYGWVSLIWVHNETGQIHDLGSQISELKQRNPSLLIHIDAVQAWGRLPLEPLYKWGDAVSFSGTKVGALPGVGVLWVSGKHEKSWLKRVPPVQNEASWIAVASLGAACGDLHFLTENLAAIAVQRDQVEKSLKASLGDRLEIVGLESARLPTTSLFLFHGVRERAIADALDMEGIRVGTGAACRSGTAEPSPTLLALGYSAELAKTATRLSWSSPLTELALTHVTTRVKSIAQRAMGL